MVTAAAMLRKFKAMDTLEVIGESIEQTREEAIALNREQLYKRGEKSDGTKMKPYRNTKYAQKKNQRNPGPGLGIPDAYNTGSLQQGIFVDVRSDVAVFDSLAPTATFMIQRDGEKIFGLTVDSKERYRTVLMPSVLRRIKAITGVQ